jgi:hypothetical protein
MGTTSNTKNSIVLTRGITDKDTPSFVNQETIEKLAKNVLTNMSTKELKEDEGDVLCKMVIKGKASRLKTIVDKVLDAYYESAYTSGGIHHPEINKSLKMTFMIQEAKEEK